MRFMKYGSSISEPIFKRVNYSVKDFFFDICGGGDEGVGGEKASGAPRGRDSIYSVVEGNAKAAP